MRHIISVLIENESGALSRLVGLFSARGYNIDSLCVNVTQDVTLSRLTLTTEGPEVIVEQILKQLNKLIEVVKVTDLNEGGYVERELSLVKIKANSKERRDFLDLITIYEGVVVDISTHNMMVELTGSQDKINAFIEIVGKEHILEIARTGTVGLGRGERVMSIS
ncbi:MAG: acetolactate synthase small subunit [Francisella sp.]|jgi:acetolactate synthase, small subunit|nr:MAG: acetolactate synthase small subunit [Francisella sp.]